ncbi:hypothetical protein AVEN_5838-1 [Araneus ventricosus]|uniref:Tc3 transposase DNA binding domain-containing protein n=1 Tax=Araneus ventricosus TaxID=182803 RepID=A0A4Y2F5V0_ARAVE|nr:hypothetical protein AVEN_5838-1 [Araneus ventricosus]
MSVKLKYTEDPPKKWYRHAYANKEIWSQSEYGAAIGNAYIRQQVSGTVVRSVTAATMAGYQDLSKFTRGVIVGAREMGHSISEVAMKFGFSRTTISRMYREYRESGKTSNLRHGCGRKKIIQERDQRRLTIIIKRDRRATLPQIAADFNEDINKFQRANHSTKHHRCGLSEPKAHSCTLDDCTILGRCTSFFGSSAYFSLHKP